MILKIKINWSYKEKSGIAFDNFGYDAFNPKNEDAMEGLYFWYEEGNGACDCNRSRICGLPQMECGHEIKFNKIEPIIGVD